MKKITSILVTLCLWMIVEPVLSQNANCRAGCEYNYNRDLQMAAEDWDRAYLSCGRQNELDMMDWMSEAGSYEELMAIDLAYNNCLNGADAALANAGTAAATRRQQCETQCNILYPPSTHP